MEISDLSGHRYGHDERNPAHCLDSFYHRSKAPSRDKFGNLLCQTVDACLRIDRGIHIVLEHNLLRWVLEAERRQPAPVGNRPPLLPRKSTAVPQKKRLKVLPRLPEDPHRCCPRADKIAHDFMCGIRNPDRRQLARTMQFRQHYRIPAVGFHTVPWLHWNE